MALFENADSSGRSSGRSVTQHMYKNMYFYSSSGRALPPQVQQALIASIDKMPPQAVRLLAGTKVVVQEERDRTFAPIMRAWMLKNRFPLDWYRNGGYDESNQAMAGQHGTGGLALIRVGPPLRTKPNGAPVLNRGYTEDTWSKEFQSNVVPHESAHLLDFELGVRRQLALLYVNTLRSGASPAIAKGRVAAVRSTLPSDDANQTLSWSKEFGSTVPKGYDAGYVEQVNSFGAHEWGKHSEGPNRYAETFANALQHYWNGGIVPSKMQSFFDSRPELKRHINAGVPSPGVFPNDRVGLAPLK